MEYMKNKNKKIQIEFDSEHLPVIINALETYSRLQSGQVGMAMDIVYADRNLSWDERQHIEGTVRFMAFPANPRREYDGHGGFYDQYNNEYDESGNIAEESEDWKNKKNRPHLDHANSSFGVGCPEMKGGTVAWEIKKAIEEYLHYQRNNGYRDMGVDGDGVLNISGIPNAKIIDTETKEYWEPVKRFPIPPKYQTKIADLIQSNKFSNVWALIDKVFKDKKLPAGKCMKVEEKDSLYYVVVEKPYKLK
jgi:hypothetical protein